MKKYSFPAERDARADVVEKYGFEGDLLDIWASNSGAAVHKWHHYIPLYDRYFSAWRGTAVRFLEIGVNRGGSLQMWRRYFGEAAVIFGIDINRNCAQYDGLAGQVRIGSQADGAFLESVVDEMGGIDIVLDDGSHQMAHVRETLVRLFPMLENGGLYMIEDLHTAYFPSFGGGFREKGNFFNLARKMIDDMHRWYHRKGLAVPALGGAFTGIHIHDSMIVIEKNEVHAPVHSRIR